MTNYIMDNEVWKDIKGYEGYYQVSNLGNVRSLDRIILCKDGSERFTVGKSLKPQKDYQGYLRVYHFKLLHHLSLQYFIRRVLLQT